MMPYQYQLLTITCFQASLSEVSKAEQATRQSHEMIDTKRAPVNPKQIYCDTPPAGGVHTIRAMLFEPSMSPGTTAMFVNMEDGWNTLANCIAIHLKCTAAQIITSSPTVPYPHQWFELWRDGASYRTISSYYDGDRWQWDESGEPLDFEDISMYSRKRIKDRLSRQLLFDYMRQLGWDVSRKSFWRSEGNGLYISEERR